MRTHHHSLHHHRLPATAPRGPRPSATALATAPRIVVVAPSTTTRSSSSSAGTAAAAAATSSRGSSFRRDHLRLLCTGETVETAAETAGAAETTAKAEENAADEDVADQGEAVSTEGEENEESEPAHKSLVDKIKAAVEGDDSEAASSMLSDLEAELATLSDQVASAQDDSTKIKEQYLRLNADFDNYRKRTETEKESLSKNARGSTLEELLPVIDNFEAARTQLKLETEAEQKVSDSYQNLYKSLVETLRKLGLSPIESVGSTFDPELHDAIMQEETTDHEDGSVLEEYRKGFLFGDRLLRPAMVKVAVNASQEAAPQAEEAEAEAAATEEGESGTGGEDAGEGE